MPKLELSDKIYIDKKLQFKHYELPRFFVSNLTDERICFKYEYLCNENLKKSPLLIFVHGLGEYTRPMISFGKMAENLASHGFQTMLLYMDRSYRIMAKMQGNIYII